MPIPDFQTVMLPALRELADGNEHFLRDVTARLAGQFGLTREEQRQLLPSGKQPVFLNRVGWARTYMKKAGLVENTGRGRVRITEEGKRVLEEAPERIDNRFLMRYPEFREWKGYTPPDAEVQQAELVEDLHEELTPEEILELNHRRLSSSLAQDLLARVKQSPPEFFERLVVDLLVAMGYGGSREDAGQAVGGSGDEGIDGVINEDRLGLDVVYVQAKRWEANVGRPVVQAFVGSLEGRRAQKGVLITTSSFTPDARDFVKRIGKKIVLIDGNDLADYMIDHGVGVTTTRTYDVKEIDASYFDEESP